MEVDGGMLDQRGIGDPATSARAIARRLGASPTGPTPAGTTGGATANSITIEAEPRPNRRPPARSGDMVLGRSLPDPPAITARDLQRARVSNHPVLRVQIIDLSGALSRYRSTMMKAIEKGLNEVRETAPEHMRSMGMPGFTTITSYQRREPGAAEKGAQLPLEFPVYAVPRKRDRSSRDRDGRAMLRRIMQEYGVPARSQKAVLSDWGDRRIYGAAAPPLLSFRKVVFLDSDQLERDDDHDAYFYSNVILHELGHALNVAGRGSHPHDGSVMQPGLPPHSLPASYKVSHAKHILVTINNAWREELKQLEPR